MFTLHFILLLAAALLAALAAFGAAHPRFNLLAGAVCLFILSFIVT